MAFLPHDHDHVELCQECCQDVTAALNAKAASPDGHAIATGFPQFSAETVELVVRNTIDTVLKLAGPAMVNAVLTQKDAIRKIVTPLALQTFDAVLHGLQDTRLTPPRRSDPV